MRNSIIFLFVFFGQYISAQNWETLIALPGNSPIKQIEVVNDNNIYVSSQYYKLYNYNGTEWNSLGNFNPGFNGKFSYIADTEIYAIHNTYIKSNNVNEYNYIAKWNGTTWSNFGNFNQPKPIHNFKIVSNTEAYAVGEFDDLEDYRWRPVARFNGNSWNIIGKEDTNAGTYSGNSSLWVNSENDIYSKWDGYRSNGNEFVKHWNGNSWTILANGNKDEVDGVDKIHVVNENEIYINTWTKNMDYGVIGKWDGDYWKILGDIQTDLNTGGFYGSLDFVFVNTNEIYAFGSALRHKNNFTYQVAIWNGTKWNALGNLQANNPVTTGFYKDGFLYVGGSFTEGGKTVIKKIDTKKVLSNTNFFNLQKPKVFPNPVSIICSFDKEYQQIKLYSVLGKLILEENNKSSINLSKVKKGFYILEFKTEEGQKILRKIVKK
ncbi:T9SS type A sorting domain-containing protein [Polaribacter aestuariivivens]|uniref:T9SS type A sorting domain-containing protein n=1 Tax=Polaribacter aestuariivivens TaxID=2304626 RepID=UPI003F4951D6